MSFFAWLLTLGLVAEYGHVLAGLAVGIPLCFVHPLLGIAAGFGIGLYVKLQMNKD